MKSKALNNSPIDKSIVFYLGSARFKPYLHPSVCTQCHLGLDLFISLFLYLQVFVKCVYPHFFTFSRTRHSISRHPPPSNRASSSMCQEEMSDVAGQRL